LIDPVHQLWQDKRYPFFAADSDQRPQLHPISSIFRLGALFT
jgi:hypothetical protein